MGLKIDNLIIVTEALVIVAARVDEVHFKIALNTVFLVQNE